jgi:quinol monooxygenase YgiN
MISTPENDSSGMASLIPPEVASSTGPVAVLGSVRPNEGMAAEVMDILLSFVEPSRADPASNFYQPHLDASKPGVIVFYENWSSGRALLAHLGEPFMAALTSRTDLLADMQLNFLTPIEPGAPQS